MHIINIILQSVRSYFYSSECKQQEWLFNDKVFSNAVPRIWNSLPDDAVSAVTDILPAAT